MNRYDLLVLFGNLEGDLRMDVRDIVGNNREHIPGNIQTVLVDSLQKAVEDRIHEYIEDTTEGKRYTWSNKSYSTKQS